MTFILCRSKPSFAHAFFTAVLLVAGSNLPTALSSFMVLGGLTLVLAAAVAVATFS